MADHYIVVDKNTNEIIGTTDIVEQAMILRNNWKSQRPRPMMSFSIYNPEDPDVEIRVYKEL